MSGFFKVYRDAIQSDLLQQRDVLQVWIWLCKHARFKPCVQNNIELQPGQLLVSGQTIARDCLLDTNRVQYILRCLEKNGFISRQNIRNRCSLITVRDPAEQQDHEADITTPTVVSASDCATQTVVPASDAKTQTVAVTPEQKTQSVAVGADAKTQAVVSAPDITKQADAPVQPENGAKTACGMFGNVYLSAEEKRLLRQYSAAYESYVNNLSAYKKRTGKTYTDDFTLLMEWISKDDIRQKRAAADRTEQEKSAPAAVRAPLPRYAYLESSEPASYDLEKAERQARESVPKLRKRPKK